MNSGDRLCRAAADGNIDKAKNLLQTTDVNWRQKHDHRTPLHRAASKGKAEMIELLLEHKADVTCKDIDGQTPLYAAVICGNKDIVKLLATSGADVNTKHNNGQTVLHEAVRSGNIELTRVLILCGAKVNTRDNDGYKRTPLDRAVQDGNTSMAELLIKSGANVNKPNTYGQTPLHRAASNADLNMLTLLLHCKDIKVNKKDSDGNTAVHEAAMKGNSDVMNLLLESGADINITNHNSDTALDCAIEGGHITMTEMMLDSRERSTLDQNSSEQLIEKAGDNTEMVSFLQDYWSAAKKNQVIHHLDEITVTIERAKTSIGQRTAHLQDSAQSLNDMSKEVDDLAKVLATLTDMRQDLKAHIDNSMRTIRNDLRKNTDSVKNEIAVLTTYTCEKLSEVHDNDEYGHYVYYKVSQVISQSVGSKVNQWKILAEKLFHVFPPVFARRKIAEIDRSQTSDTKKAFEVLIYWKTFSGDSRMSVLLEVVDELDLKGIKECVENISNTYMKDKERDHTGCLAEQGLLSLAAQIGVEWRSLGCALGLEKARTDQLQHNYPTDIKTAIWSMLIEWRNTTKGTVEEKFHQLRKALEMNGRNDLAQTLEL